MRVRRLDQNGDMTFGADDGNYLVNSPDAVGQCIKTALGLWQGQWFLDTSAGVPYNTKVLGRYTGSTRDVVLRNAILGVPGVTAILAYASQLDRNTRKFSVQATVNTLFGQTIVSAGPI